MAIFCLSFVETICVKVTSNVKSYCEVICLGIHPVTGISVTILDRLFSAKLTRVDEHIDSFVRSFYTFVDRSYQTFVQRTYPLRLMNNSIITPQHKCKFNEDLYEFGY